MSQEQNQLLYVVNNFQRIIDKSEYETIESLLTSFPQSAEAQFLAGSYFAEKQDYYVAKSHFMNAIEANKEYDIARFQLCFLAVLNKDFETFDLSSRHFFDSELVSYYQLFAKALSYILEDLTIEAVKLIEEGILLNKENASLNQNMKLIIEIISKLKDTELSKGVQTNTHQLNGDEVSAETNSVLLDIYKNKFN
ncbi:hypothetical protein C1E23_20580 [Pseudoalteromonas phenolica]|uniref:Tetratricopeptide repeat protein n=1 Tax=Pseudoalteromonas phenolica TaxID=161398 RepID=A0A4Q7II23_9GAMM|nr:hypothetical protein [Pseudoalteromonas phenolica]RZQ51241.1 hypothetical protein C1E23_20580 [Pseudoalteromonas phenolica]